MLDISLTELIWHKLQEILISISNPQPKLTTFSQTLNIYYQIIFAFECAHFWAESLHSFHKSECCCSTLHAHIHIVINTKNWMVSPFTIHRYLSQIRCRFQTWRLFCKLTCRRHSWLWYINIDWFCKGQSRKGCCCLLVETWVNGSVCILLVFLDCYNRILKEVCVIEYMQSNTELEINCSKLGRLIRH